MAAQIVSPIAAGTMLNRISYMTLFPYAAAAVILAFVTMQFVRHGDSKEGGPKGLEAFEEMEI